MAEPCRQEKTIGHLEEAIKAMAEGQREIIALMKDQSANKEQMRRQEKDINNLFCRVRELEIAPGEEAGQVKTGTLTAIISAIIAALVAWVMGQQK